MDITLNNGMVISVATSVAAEEAAGVREAENLGKNTETEQTQTKANYDTVELSEEARQYLTETESVGESVTAAAESGEITSSDLYSYSESELKELLTNGDITRSEYDREIAKRAAGVPASDE